MFKFKTVCGDDTMIQFKDRFGKVEKFTTDKLMLLSLSSANNASDDTALEDLDTTPIPDDQTLSQATPTKPPRSVPGKKTARKMHDAKHCRICNIKHGSREDKVWDSPWIGCCVLDARQGDCLYWIHSKCKGFPYATQVYLDNEEMDYYCPDHLKLGFNLPAGANKEKARGGKKRKIFKR